MQLLGTSFDTSFRAVEKKKRSFDKMFDFMNMRMWVKVLKSEYVIEQWLVFRVPAFVSLSIK